MINVYCDESCHLEYDNSNVMLMGAMYCENMYKDKIFNEIRDIKKKYNLSTWFEIKWTKVSMSKFEFYKELIDYFFNNKNLFFRIIVAHDKKKLNHYKYNNGSFDLWYYKMYYLLLDNIICPNNEYRIFIDIKDTNGGPKVRKLKEVLCNNIYDFKNEVVKSINQVNSKESEILQLTDLLMGCIGYYNRNLLYKDNVKRKIIEYTLKNYDVDFNENTAKIEKKFNVFHWYPRR
ncbi:DUF3800 domain-containing protein [Clostridium felsineum]|uniref:DUF3800 domain-containing protein n=1 Tax=Clostridium felsineum TaxID=36839 RepID=UPI00098C5411|nr:DUF3800 domain-containing protein [Clostridium felsineum]URZ02728.1 hypothetical protein CLAUR_027520 [Clostridium felsineum]